MTGTIQEKKVKKLILLALAATMPFTSVSLYAAASTNNTKPIPAPVQSNAMMGPVSYADAVALAAPAVVSIHTTKEMPAEMNPLLQDPYFRFFFGDPRGMEQYGNPQNPEKGGQPNQPPNAREPLPKDIRTGLGSGVIVSDKGYILTNNHVIQDVDTISVTLPDGRKADAKIIGTDPDTDLAVLQINLDKLPNITMGSSEKLRVGDVVLAIGNPFGLDKTVTQGIISALERTGAEIGLMQNLLQTDAAINPGNSGGALIDANGRLIGINTAIVSGTGGYQGIGFAIPIDNALDIMNKLIKTGYISRGYLGVSLQNLTPEIREQIGYKEGEGAFVRAIVNNSPAQKAGLLPGDIITKVNNIVVNDNRQAMQIVSALTPGKSYALEIFRRGEHMTFTVVLGDRKPPQSAAKQPDSKGN